MEVLYSCEQLTRLILNFGPSWRLQMARGHSKYKHQISNSLYFMKMDAIFDFLKGSQRKFCEKIIGLEFISEHISL